LFLLQSNYDAIPGSSVIFPVFVLIKKSPAADIEIAQAPDYPSIVVSAILTFLEFESIGMSIIADLTDRKVRESCGTVRDVKPDTVPSRRQIRELICTIIASVT